MTEQPAGLSQWLIEQCPDGVIYADADGRIALWNAAAEKIFGFTAAQVLGQSLDIIIPDKLREPHWRGFDAALAAGTTKHQGKALPTRALKADGSVIYVELSFAVIIDDQGHALGALSQARDIDASYRKAKEDRARLKALEQQLANN